LSIESVLIYLYDSSWSVYHHLFGQHGVRELLLASPRLDSPVTVEIGYKMEVQYLLQALCMQQVAHPGEPSGPFLDFPVFRECLEVWFPIEVRVVWI
jgi:hypothetical protein